MRPAWRLRVSANEEAIRCLTQAVTLVERLPPGRERDDRELGLRDPLAAALNSARGVFRARGRAEPGSRVRAARAATSSRRSRSGGCGPVSVSGSCSVTCTARESWPSRRLRAAPPIAWSRGEAHHAMGGALASPSVSSRPGCRHFDAALDVSGIVDTPAVVARVGSGRVRAGLVVARALVARRRGEGRLNAPAMRSRSPSGTTTPTAKRSRWPMRHFCISSGVTWTRCCGARGPRPICANDTGSPITVTGRWPSSAGRAARPRPADGVAMIRSALERLDARRAQARRPYYLSLLAETLAGSGNRGRARWPRSMPAIAMALERGDVWWLPALYLQQSGVGGAGHR